MIRDLVGAGQVLAEADYLVIGAGTVGLMVATELAARGKRVICMESGGRQQQTATHPLNETEQTGETRYAGADDGRFRCLGGTSTRWGGALIPFQAADIEDANWPISFLQLAPHLLEVEALFSLPSGLYEDPSIAIGRDYIARLAKWPPFKKRNVYTLLRSEVNAENGPKVWINATATRFVVKGGKLERVTAQSGEGDALTVTAKEVVLCSGAIESTRLLLLIQHQNPGSLTGAMLGQGLHDHLSAVVGEIELRDRKALNKLAGFRFAPGGSMRNLRFELAPDSPLRCNVPRCFAHIGFSETQGGFSALRDIYRALQRRRLPPLETFVRLAKGSAWLSKAVWWRFVHRRLLIPDAARIQLHMVIEQKPHQRNQITLSDNKTDRFGLPLAKIEWRVQPADLEAMQAAIDAFVTSWQEGNAAEFGAIRLREFNQIAAEMQSGGGIYHPGGSARFSSLPTQGVTDSSCAVWGIKNLTVLATSLFPSGGGANPTMTMLMISRSYLSKVS